MKRFARHSFNVLVGIGLTLPAAGYAAPVVPANEPLFLSGTVKHNVMLAIDDSGSMDFETLFSVNDGALWLGTDGSFVKPDGSFNDADEPGVRSQTQGGKYVYLLPNGRNGTYDGRKINAGHYSLPPIKPFAFARSAAFNKSYYDPSAQYDPWPSYGGISFSDIDPKSAPFDARRSTQANLDLTSDINTTNKGGDWGFEINDSDMPCTDAGGACGATGTANYTYFPAHYYVVKSTGQYTFTPTSGVAEFDSAKSVLLEGESAVRSGQFQLASATNSTIFSPTLIGNASGNDYVGVDDTVGNFYDNPPIASTSQLDFGFSPKVAGAHIIWLRRRMASGSEDSLWINLVGYEDDDVALVTPGNDEWQETSEEDWNKWYNNHTTSDSWVWEPWAKVNFAQAGSGQSLRLRHREPGVLLDQVLITPEVGTPSGAVVLTSAPTTSVVRDCAVDSDPSHYGQFFADTSQFSGVDAIGPGGECLTRVEIKPTETSYGYTDSNGNSQTRSYDEEITNFANWFTYYRRRHQAVRGGIASAFQGLGGIQTGLFWINNRRQVSMYDMDMGSDITSFLNEQYDYVSSGGTPNREALDHAAQQFRRSDSSAPITVECQKNFTLLFTDGFSNNSTVSDIGNTDGNAGAPYADQYSSSLGDIAYKYYEENLRTDLPTAKVRVPSGCNATNPDASLDCNTNLHMNTYTAGLGAEGNIFGVTHNKVADAYTNPPTWPDTGLRDKRMIDDLYHAAVNGRGEMFNALTPAELRTQLAAALRDIITSIGNSSSVTFNTGTLNSESLVFSASFNSTAWSGNLSARELDSTTGDVESVPVWSAGSRLDGQNPDDRVILTYSNTSSGGVPFRWDTTVLDAGQQADLNTSVSGAADTRGEQRLNYLRGNRTGEGQLFRNRSSVLGDIVHSTPLFVGNPSLNWPDSDPFGSQSDRYSNFRNITAVGRTPVVYVGANDGMLHGFNAKESVNDGGGEEVIAYVPRSVYSSNTNEGLNYLTQPDYGHRYYVDLSPQAVDVYTRATPTGLPAWRTVLLGGLRNGGVGFFALDITDPDAFSESNAADIVLWEFNESHDKRLNYVTSEPTVGLMPNGRWAMILGNGLANDSTASDEKTGVFIVYMDGGLDGTWTEGTDYEFIELADTGGLSTVEPLDTNGDSIVDRIYGGDQQGNMWTVDVSSKNATNWGSAYFVGNNNSTPAPLFTATDDAGNPQPISSRPLVIRNVESSTGSEGANGEDYLVYFGSGRYFTQGDAANTEDQTFYGVWDRTDTQLTRSNLVEQPVILSTNGLLRQSGSNSVDWGNVSGNGREYGWFMDLPETGERVINSPQIRGKIVFFETFTPSQSPCDGGGTSWLMSVDLDGSNPDSAVFDTNNDGKIDDSDGLYIGARNDDQGTGSTAFLGDGQYINDSNEDGVKKRDTETGDSGQRTGRLGWQELLEP